MKKLKKKVSGMTLIEVIIAMLVFSIMSLVMVQIGSVTKSLMMNTNHMNNKTNAEAPIAAVKDVSALNEAASDATDESGNAHVIETLPVTITVSVPGYSALVNAVKYDTGAAAAASDRNCDTRMDGDLEFYVIEDPTEAPTT